MPILDAGAYSQPNTEYLLSMLVDISGDEAFHEKNDVFFFNLYLGDKYVSFPEGMSHFHVCRNMDYGYLFAIFHTVRRQDVIGENVMFPDYRDTCLTLLWTAESDCNDHVTAALNYADEVIRNLEFATGKAIPIGLGEIQRQSNFEVAHVKVIKGVVDRISLQHDRKHVPTLTPKIAPILNALMGFDDEYETIKNTEPVKSYRRPKSRDATGNSPIPEPISRVEVCERKLGSHLSGYPCRQMVSNGLRSPQSCNA
jgi:hypothetical protein